MGGAERHVLDLAYGLRARGAEVHVTCPRPGPLVERLRAHGFDAQCLEMVFPRPGDEYGLDVGVVRRLAQRFQERAPDVVHSHLYPAHLHASLAAVEAGVPAVVHTAHTLVVRPGEVLLGRLTAAQTIATSTAVRDLLAGMGVPPTRLEVVYNGVGTEHFEVPPELVRRARASLGLGDGPVLGTVARLSHEKGVDVLVRALSRVAQAFPSATLVIVGDGPQAKALHALVGRLRLERAVRFLGARADVAVLNRLIDVFVLPSREEACPIALLEAMAAGRPAIATRVGGSAEVITDAVDGRLVLPGRPDRLARMIVELLNDETRRSALGAAARRTAETRFTNDRTVDQTLAVYRRLLGPSR
ncbi:MAG: glycosyltransferase [Chloroflexi bacterium]|nr:glycosyltransferase [Chloroflexota bacterium]